MRDGGTVNYKRIPRFNGGLFAEVDPVPLTADELAALAAATALDWGGIEPAIFGTLFERSLDPRQRAQLGAHYTGRADILRVVEPVVMAPLRLRWAAVRAETDGRRDAWLDAKDAGDRTRKGRAFASLLGRFQDELAAVRILDPACGSGNFLYVALAALKDLEKQVIAYAAANGLPAPYPLVGPGQLHGLEVNEYARELAQVVVWIGYLQWTRDHGFRPSLDPVLEPLETIRLQDALLDRSDPEHPKEARGRRRILSSGTRRSLAATGCGRSWGTSTCRRSSPSTTAECRPLPTSSATSSRGLGCKSPLAQANELGYWRRNRSERGRTDACSIE